MFRIRTKSQTLICNSLNSVLVVGEVINVRLRFRIRVRLLICTKSGAQTVHLFFTYLKGNITLFSILINKFIYNMYIWNRLRFVQKTFIAFYLFIYGLLFIDYIVVSPKPVYFSSERGNSPLLVFSPWIYKLGQERQSQ